MRANRNPTLLVVVIITLSMVLTGCLFSPTSSKVKSGDLIISPESEQILTNNANSALLNNRMNNSNIPDANNVSVQLSAGMVYDKIGNKVPWIDFDTDSKNLYLLRDSVSADSLGQYGDAIEVYDSESQRYKYRITHENLKTCSTISVRGELVYAYDAQSGKIFSFSLDGRLQRIDNTSLPGLTVKKMEIGNDKYLFLMTYDAKTSQSAVFILDKGFKLVDKIDIQGLMKYLKYGSGEFNSKNIDIQDFCVKDNNYILIKILPSRLGLFNYKTHQLEKVSVITDDTGYICFDGGILYGTSGRSLGVFTNSLTNFSYKGNFNIVNRVLINEEYPWTIDAGKLSDWYLGDLNIPFARENFYHKKISQTNKYLYLMDEKLPISEQKDNFESVIYRVLK